MLTFTGKAPAGQYFIYLMAEDLIPVPKISQVTDNKPLSSVPVHLSLTGKSDNKIIAALMLPIRQKIRISNYRVLKHKTALVK